MLVRKPQICKIFHHVLDFFLTYRFPRTFDFFHTGERFGKSGFLPFCLRWFLIIAKGLNVSIVSNLTNKTTDEYLYLLGIQSNGKTAPTTNRRFLPAFVKTCAKRNPQPWEIKPGSNIGLKKLEGIHGLNPRFCLRVNSTSARPSHLWAWRSEEGKWLYHFLVFPLICGFTIWFFESRTRTYRKQ